MPSRLPWSAGRITATDEPAESIQFHLVPCKSPSGGTLLSESLAYSEFAGSARHQFLNSQRSSKFRHRESSTIAPHLEC
jgi:hypothetical protein